MDKEIFGFTNSGSKVEVISKEKAQEQFVEKTSYTSSNTEINNNIRDLQNQSKIYYGSSQPASTLGKNGDVYFLYEE